MTIERIDLYPEYGFTFSTCVVAGDFVYTSHLAGLDEDGKWPESVEEQTEHCFRNLEKVLGAAGATLSDVVKMTVYLKNIDDFDKMRQVYRRQFTDGYPARMTATSEFIDPEILVMIEAVAYKPR
jgi:2-iminobutanoate/2-iminopropanoate deaminase